MIASFRQMLSRRGNVRAHFWQTCSNYTQQASGLILSVLLARLLTPSEFGEFAYIGAVITLFLLPVGWSLSPQVLAEARSHPEVVSDALHYSRILLVPRVLMALAACTFLFWMRGWQQGIIALILSIPLIGSDFVAVLRAALEGRGVFKANFYDSVLTAAATGLISIPAAFFGAGVWSFVIPALPLFIGQLILYLRMSGLQLSPSAAVTSRSYLRSGTALWICSCSESALLRVDKFFLGQWASMSSLGDYNRAFNFSPLAARLLNSLLANPTVASLTQTTDSSARRNLLSKSAIVLFLAGSANFVLWWFFSDPLVPWLFGPNWNSAIPVFEAMAPLSLAISVAYLPSTLAMAKRAYLVLAWVRSGTLALFLILAFFLQGRMDAVLMGGLLQGTLFLQGLMISLALLLIRFARLRRHYAQ